LRGHAQIVLQEHRQREHRREQPDTHHDAEERADPHLPVAEHAEVDHGVVRGELAPHEQRAGDYK
jgi:hypothetical protein